MELVVRHEGGFFSCCTVRLHYLIHHFNNYKSLPNIFNTKDFYTWYKPDNYTDDITFHYFKHYNDEENSKINIIYDIDIDFNEWYQYKIFNTLDFNRLEPFIRKYYTPSDAIENIKKHLENKYSIDYNNICVLFYRGNDKATESKLPAFDEYISYAEKILIEEPNIKFLIQSDETNFINEMQYYFPNNIIFNDEIRHIYKTNTTVDVVFKQKNYEYSLYFLAIILIISKCKYIICNSGNCALWMYFYRKTTDNIVQLSAIANI
jgi:hypothetical protein